MKYSKVCLFHMLKIEKPIVPIWPVHMEGGTQRGEIPHLLLVKKYLSSHVMLGMRDEGQNAITWLLSTHMNKELSFLPMKLLLHFYAFVVGKTLV